MAIQFAIDGSGRPISPKSLAGYLDPELAGEGQKVILSDGEQVSWSPPPPQPIMPDWSKIKSIAKYFNRTGHQVYPAWLYHASNAEPPRLVKNAEEAAQLGVVFRKTTDDERNKYGLTDVWDWQHDSPWRPKPHPDLLKFDPRKSHQGKTYVPTPPNPTIAQNELLRDLVPLVTSAVAQALKGGAAPSAPANVAPADWDEFLKFKAWQASQQAVDAIASIDPADESEGQNALNPITPEQDWMIWANEYKARFGKDPDKRWNLETLKAKVEQA